MSAREENELLGIMGPWRRRARELRLKDAEHLSRAAHVPAVDPALPGALPAAPAGELGHEPRHHVPEATFRGSGGCWKCALLK